MVVAVYIDLSVVVDAVFLSVDAFGTPYVFERQNSIAKCIAELLWRFFCHCMMFIVCDV